MPQLPGSSIRTWISDCGYYYPDQAIWRASPLDPGAEPASDRRQDAVFASYYQAWHVPWPGRLQTTGVSSAQVPSQRRGWPRFAFGPGVSAANPATNTLQTRDILRSLQLIGDGAAGCGPNVRSPSCDRSEYERSEGLQQISLLGDVSTCSVGANVLYKRVANIS